MRPSADPLSNKAFGGPLPDALHRLGHRIPGNRVHQSHPQRLGGRDFFRRDEHFQRAPFAD
jgi:hypothetical protein